MKTVKNEKSAPIDADMSSLWGGSAAETDTHPRAAWFRASRYAMFIHWGLYSEAGGNWQGKTWHGISEWLMRRAQIPVKEYETLAARFNPTGFNADAWARLAKAAGMRYLVITAKHHEGFAMFPSKVSAFNIVEASPFKRDPIAELAVACRRHGLGLGFYYSQFIDWHEKDAAGNNWDFTGERDFNHYLTTKALPQITELLTHYGPVALIWFDTPGSISRESSQALYDHIRRLQPECLVNSRIGNGLGDYSCLGDQEVPLTGPAGLWESCDTHNDTWAFSKTDQHWKSPSEIISRIVRVSSLGGNYMLNVGPDGKGVIPEASANILRQVGQWLKRNGAAIYGAGRSPIPAQAWGVCTSGPGKLYLHILQWPSNGELLIPGLSVKLKKASVLATGKKLAFSRRAGCLAIKVPLVAPEQPITVIVLETIGAIKVNRPELCIHPDLANELNAPFATRTACGMRKVRWMEKFGDWHHVDVIHELTGSSAFTWTCRALAKGTFNAVLEVECLPEGDGSELELTLGEDRLHFPVFCTGNRHENRARLRQECLGVVTIKKSGPLTVTIRPLAIKGTNALFISRVILQPIK